MIFQQNHVYIAKSYDEWIGLLTALQEAGYRWGSGHLPLEWEGGLNKVNFPSYNGIHISTIGGRIFTRLNAERALVMDYKIHYFIREQQKIKTQDLIDFL